MANGSFKHDDDRGAADAELLRRFARDRSTGFELIYERYAVPLSRYVYRFTADAAVTEEVLHDVFVQLLDGRFEGVSLKAWLYTVAKNRALTLGKKRRRETSDEQAMSKASTSQDFESEVIHKDLQTHLANVEKNLPADLKETWRLRREGFDYAEIANHLAIPVGTVKSRFSRLVTLLKKEFGT